jgi:hypothetical protein
MHGLPKHTKEELVKMKKQYDNKVDFREFLPNSIVASPKTRSFSNSFKTKQLGLCRAHTAGNGSWSTRASMQAPSETPHKALEEVEFDPEINRHKIYSKAEEKLLAEKASVRLAARTNRETSISQTLSARKTGFNQYINGRIPV